MNINITELKFERFTDVHYSISFNPDDLSQVRTLTCMFDMPCDTPYEYSKDESILLLQAYKHILKKELVKYGVELLTGFKVVHNGLVAIKPEEDNNSSLLIMHNQNVERLLDYMAFILGAKKGSLEPYQNFNYLVNNSLLPIIAERQPLSAHEICHDE